MRNARKRKGMLCFCLMLFMSFGQICASERTVNAAEQMVDLNASYISILFNAENGLPTSEANDVVQTEDGFIWIGSYSGLIRYDGTDFYHYDAESGITGVATLYVDSLDRLWIGTNDNGIARYENGSFKFFTKQDGVCSNTVKTFSEDEEGNVYFGSTEGIGYISNDDKVHIVDTKLLPNKYINDISKGVDNSVVGVTKSGDVFCMKEGHVTACIPSVFFEKSTPICIRRKNSSNMYFLGTEKGNVLLLSQEFLESKEAALEVTTEKITSIDTGKFESINNILDLGKSGIFLCCDNGIGYLDEQNLIHEMTDVKMDNSVECMMVDFEGNFWFASSRQGVMEVTQNRFNNISKIGDLDKTIVNTTCIDEDRLYIGTDNGLVILQDKTALIENELTNLLKGIRIREIIKDSKGNLWLATYGKNGLVKYTPDGVVSCITEGMPSDHLRTIMECRNGDMFIGTGGGAVLLHNDAVKQVYGAQEGITNLEILCLAEDGNGTLYAGSDGGGVFVIKDNTVSKLSGEDGLRSEVILRMRNDEKDPSMMWILTGNSIVYAKSNKMTTVTKFPYTNNFDIRFDHMDSMWVLSSNGIYVVHRNDMIANGDIPYTLYNNEDGLSSYPVANSRNCLDTDGTLYIPCSGGVNYFRMRELVRNDSISKLLVPSFTQDGKMIYIGNKKRAEINSSCKRLSIHPYVFSFTLQDPEVSYQLIGFDLKPILTTKSQLGDVTYTNLKGGEYTFCLQEIDSQTGEVRNKIQIPIHKEKTLYEKAWFWGIMAGSILLVIFACLLVAMRIRTTWLLDRQKLRDKIITQMIAAFAKAIDAKDKYTEGHSARVAVYARLIARKLGWEEEEVKDCYSAALLHDIGKIAIPDAILNKKGKLTAEEYNLMKTHTTEGSKILKEITSYPLLSEGAMYHHERYDGTGYTTGVSGDEIPKFARAIAVADAFDAMNSTRSYRSQMKFDEIIAELKRCRDTQLDGECLDAFLSLIEEGVVTREETYEEKYISPGRLKGIRRN